MAGLHVTLRKARPERVAERAAGQREAERVVLVHCFGDEEEGGAGVAEGKGGATMKCTH